MQPDLYLYVGLQKQVDTAKVVYFVSFYEFHALLGPGPLLENISRSGPGSLPARLQKQLQVQQR